MGFIQTKDLPELELAKGIRAHIITTDTLSVLHVILDEGAILPEHSHHNEQVINVIEGELELTVSGVTYILTPGTIMVLEPNAVHSGRALTDCKVIDIFHPLREDFARAHYNNSNKGRETKDENR